MLPNNPNLGPLSHYEHIEAFAEVKKPAIAMMKEMNGWCSPQKASILIDLIFKDQIETIVEIGVFGGSSLIPMAYALKVQGKGKIYGIDPWCAANSLIRTDDRGERRFWGLVDYEAVLRDLTEKMDQFALNEQIELIRLSSEEAPPIPTIGLLHVDGNHSEEAALFDVMKWGPLVKSGGWIVFDDVSWHNKIGIYTTMKAVEWLDQNCLRFGHFRDYADHDWGVWLKL